MSFQEHFLVLASSQSFENVLNRDSRTGHWLPKSDLRINSNLRFHLRSLRATCATAASENPQGVRSAECDFRTRFAAFFTDQQVLS